MSFTDAQKTDIRRHCGYPAFGAGGGAQFAGWRFYQAYGLLEYRMNNLSAAEEAVVTTYLATLTTLEAAIPAAADNLDTDKAAVWTHNKGEVRDRVALFNGWRRRLCGFLGLPPGPDLAGAGTVTMVV